MENFMKLVFILSSILLIQNAFASKITINDWYRLNRTNNSDLAAEVCFTLEPAPSNPVFVNITVDRGTNREGNYTTWLGTNGSTCHVVSTMAGTVAVEIPQLKIKTENKKNI